MRRVIELQAGTAGRAEVSYGLVQVGQFQDFFALLAMVLPSNLIAIAFNRTGFRGSGGLSLRPEVRALFVEQC
jgi:hypothetical protein